MQKIFDTWLLCFVLASSFAQAKRNLISTYLSAQYNNTIIDGTKGNNPWGAGLGLQGFLNNNTKFKPTVELTGDLYLEDDKVFRTNLNGQEISGVNAMVNLFIGTSFNPSQKIYLSFVGGPSFIDRKTLFGIKPSVGFYFSESKKWIGRISYINIFNRLNASKEDFGSLSLAAGLKLF